MHGSLRVAARHGRHDGHFEDLHLLCYGKNSSAELHFRCVMAAAPIPGRGVEGSFGFPGFQPASPRSSYRVGAGSRI